MSERIDVLAVMDELQYAVDAYQHEGQHRYHQDGYYHLELSRQHYAALELRDRLFEARAAVAELIEAAKTLLAGSIAQAVAADHPDMPEADKADAEFRASEARDAIRAALARVQGGA